VRSLVQGQTDSERYFALVTQEIRAHDGDVSAGIAAAVSWVAANLPLFSINFVLATPHELWALRYPENHGLYVLARPAGGRAGGRALHHESAQLRVHSPHLQQHPAVVIASERMDDSPDWRPLRSGELIHVTRELAVHSQLLLDRPPAQRLEPSHPTRAQPRAG
jgi:glutamine amidotransferase